MKTDRREFLKYGLVTTSLFLGSVYGVETFRRRKRSHVFTGRLIESSNRGHQLRKAINAPVDQTFKNSLLIVGGGMSGLIAGHYLKKNGFNNFKIIELNSEAGGNSVYGENETSRYPWGAHYVPLPNKENVDLMEFFKSIGVAKTGSKGVEYSEEYLCHDPQERLLIKGEWQESLLPTKNISASDHLELARFQELVESFKYRKGVDRKYVFNVPVMESSQDPDYLRLDSVSFYDFLIEQGFYSDVFHWYVNYCTLDDFGMGATTVSAWAGLHYFCSRRPTDDHDDHKLLTWPQGNGWILQKLVDDLKGHIELNSAALTIESFEKSVATKVFNFGTKSVSKYESERIIFSAPHFLIPHIFADKNQPDHVSPDEYHSWLVANITVTLTREQLHSIHWDNVRFQSASLGYINARHQELRSHVDTKTVLTLYWPLYDKNSSATDIRRKIADFTWNDWAPKVEAELESMHPGIGPFIQSMDIKIHGHAMIGPSVGRMSRVFSQKNKSDNGRILLAHTDNSGMSLFEEAHYWGHRAAKDVLQRD